MNCAQKSYIMFFDQFWDQMTHSKATYTTKKVNYRAHILPKVSINLVLQETLLISYFYEVEISIFEPIHQ